jgi:hypothetical protein
MRERHWQWFAALAAGGAAVGLAATHSWPFDGHPHTVAYYDDPSVWQFLFGDRLMVGFVRLALVALVLYLVASVPALAVAGRWMKGFGASGLATDDAQAADKSIKVLQEEVADLTQELDEATAQIGHLLTERDEARAAAITLHNALRTVQASGENPTS